MLRVLEKLNNPRVVVGVLIVILLANGFLLYQQQRSNPTPPEEASVAGERDRDTPPKVEDTRPPEETTVRPEKTAEEETTRNGSTEPGDPDDNQSPGSDDSDEDQPDNGDSGQNDGSNSEGSGNENSGNGGSGDEGSDNGSSGNGNSDNGGSGNGGSDGSGSGDEPDADEPMLSGLTDYVRECDSDTEECIRDYMAEELPQSRYVGGRTDLGSGSNSRNRNVIYFEDPGLATCDYEREVYEAENSREYVVILIGPGSFSNQRGDECIPQA